MEILRHPGVLSTRELDVDLLQRESLTLLDEALQALIDTRSREGEQLGKLIEDRLDGIITQVDIVKAAVPRIKEAQRERLRSRIQDVIDSPDPDRLEQELAGAENGRGRRTGPPAHPRHRSTPHPQKRRPHRPAPGLPDAGTQPRSQHPGQQIRGQRNHSGSGGIKGVD